MVGCIGCERARPARTARLYASLFVLAMAFLDNCLVIYRTTGLRRLDRFDVMLKVVYHSYLCGAVGLTAHTRQKSL
jgi:hypothetical protein